MATFDSADLLDRLRDALARPTSDTALTDTQGYRLLSDAQREIAAIIAQYIPHTNYGAPVQLITSDSKLFTLPGTPTPEWIGKILIMRDLRGEPLRQGSYDDFGADFCMEGPSSIRVTGDRTWTSAAPYVRYMARPADMDGSGTAEPSLLPKEARQSVVYTAAAKWASRGGLRDPAPYLAEAHAVLWGRPEWPGHLGLIPSYQQQQAGVDSEYLPWYRGFSAASL